MHTGDLGTMDSHGYVRIIGRNKDMISRGGEKVYPREVEEFLYRHPAIQDVQIVGVPDSRLGEEIFAWVKLKSGHKPLTISDIASFCKDQIAHYKVPRYVECLAPGEDFPMTISGKIQKFILRERSVKSLASKGL
jgi:fatty-acyl-CoA synthase